MRSTIAMTSRWGLLLPGLALIAVSCLVEYSLPSTQDDSTTGQTDEEETSSGEPSMDCPAGRLACSGVCIDPASDVDNCNGCGIVCPFNWACEEGICEAVCDPPCDDFREVCVDQDVCECREGFTACDGECVDIEADNEHCGSCSNDCELGVCEGGTCVGECDPELLECEGACVDPLSDPSHCGDCDIACEAQEVCVAGECALYASIDPDDCGSCPCDAVCGDDTLCCFSPWLDTEICTAAAECE